MAATAEVETGGVVPQCRTVKEDRPIELTGRALARSVAVSLFAATALANCIAGAWYALGESSMDTTWIRHRGIMEESAGFKYAIALHWAVSQFTLGTMEVFPSNSCERAFATVVPVIAVVVLYPLLGSTIALLSHFWARPRGKKADAEKLTAAVILRQASALLLIIVTLVAFIALGFYALGESGYETWMTRMSIQDRGFLYKYLIAVHWTVCQFTLASMEVVPLSSGERIFACCVPLLSTVVFYPLIGGILLWLSRLKAPCQSRA